MLLLLLSLLLLLLSVEQWRTPNPCRGASASSAGL